MTTTFRLLGDVEVRLDGQRIALGHARQRCVLAALLVDVNRPVPAERLVDRVWGDAPPHRARNALASYLSRLRHVLAGADDIAIGREPGGYVLVADAMSVDVHRFRQLAARARETVNAVDAAALFDQALMLWRGEPFASLDTVWVNNVRAALEGEMLSVTLDRNEAALRAGRHHELLGELAAALQRYPLDERLAGQLMLAQYRSGRQADALTTYRQTRERLVEELGVDPSAELSVVQQRILAGEAAPEPVADHPPAEMPRRTTSFVGRGQEVLRVVAALRESPLVTLTGVGGVGKTRLAVEVAASQQLHLAEGVRVCELAPLSDGDAVAHAVAAALRVPQHHGLSIDDTVVEYLRGRQLLLVIDNCEHVLDATAQLLTRVVQCCPRVAVLATSREALGVAGERILPVAGLSVEEATALFCERARAGRPDFDVDREPVGAVADVCRRVDGLPLAIELAAARMRAMTSLELARRLDSVRLLSGGVRGAHPRQQSLTATIDWSYRLLTEAERSLFDRLSVFAGGFDLDAAHGVGPETGATQDDTLELLTGLVDKSMVTVSGRTRTSRYSILETLRAYGRERLRANGIDDGIATRHATYFTELAENAAAAMHGADERAWVQRMLPDYDNLRAAFEYSLAVRDVDLTLRLVTSLPELVHLRIGYEASGWAERALDIAPHDHALFPAAVGFAARGAWNRGDFDHARSLAIRAHGRVPGRGTGRVAYPGDVLADVAIYTGDIHYALAHYTAEVGRARRAGDHIRLVSTLFYAAVCHSLLGNPDAGVPAAEESMEAAEMTSNPSARSMARYALGMVIKDAEPNRALTLFDQAAELAASVQDFWWHGVAMMESAAVGAVHGDPATAARLFVEVFDHWDRVGDWSQQWIGLWYAARLLLRIGADRDALALHHTLLAAGRPSSLGEGELAALLDRVGGGGAEALSGAEAVVRARSILAGYS